MSLGSILDAAQLPSIRLVSVDLFDTVLLRDSSLQSFRFAEAASAASNRLGVGASVLTGMRLAMHEDAYRAVAAGNTDGDTSLSMICQAMALALGLDNAAARLLSETEVAVDMRHLLPNRKLIKILDAIALSGKRIVALSDTFYGSEDLRRIITSVVGLVPIAAIYSSAELGLTKQMGGAFDEVEIREGLKSWDILHIGDNEQADVDMARRAGWTAVHLKRDRRMLRVRQLASIGAATLGGFFQTPRARVWR